MDPIRRLLARLADRGTPRGAADVLAGARADAGKAAPRPIAWLPVAAAVAAIALVAGVAVAVRDDGGTTRLADATRSTTTTSTASTPSSVAASPSTTVTAAPATSSTTTAAPSTTAAPTTTTTAKASSRVASAARLVSFGDCDGFVGTVKGEALKVVGPWGLPGSMVMTTAKPMTAGPAKSAPAPAAESGNGSAPLADDTSSTNVQEAGVDEPDTVKTDGQTIFTITGGRVLAIAARGAPRLLGSLAVDGTEAFLVGSKLLVLGQQAYRYPMAAGGKAAFAPMPSGSTITVVDVSNPAAMRVTSTMSVDGSYVAARAVDGVARIVLRTSPVGLDFVYPEDGTQQAQDRAAAHNRDVVRASSLTNWSPHVTVTNAGGRTTRQGTLISCGAALRPQALAGFGMLTVVTLDPADPARSASTSVLADGDLVYASTGRLYVATNQWGRIVDERTVEPTSTTLVHEFDITDRGNARYLASGSVRGTVLNQFSFSEHDGALRVATTDSGTGGSTSQSYVSVLKQTGTALATIGQLGGIGQGERIYAVRFIGDLGYVVTFRQVDPLHVIDLSDPTRPRLAGELEIPGYSAYLHPVGDGLLLGVGQDVDANGRRAGSELSLFDVSDPAHPRRLQHATLGTSGSSSPAEFDHHAFLWWPATKLAVLPLSQYDGTTSWSGAVGMRVSPSAMSEAGRVQHPAQGAQGQPAQSPSIDRSLVVGARLFTVSYAGILASDLTTLQDQAWVPFPAA